LFTRIMAAMVAPRKTSSDKRRDDAESVRVEATRFSPADVEIVGRPAEIAAVFLS